ncbi:hypothetical protein BS50DRAFT_72728 [Corynespora cassiicola Philippines]|uniref:Uncharacterized protein n=1 Tax=Corynespora cassiicola Philippines TaxID=1448308 RepID=A0A2T2NG28_CORCC|nr:hypothetical protein BS50DRAFT_72728 [Corynespora cassiicola Philippines]
MSVDRTELPMFQTQRAASTLHIHGAQQRVPAARQRRQANHLKRMNWRFCQACGMIGRGGRACCAVVLLLLLLSVGEGGMHVRSELAWELGWTRVRAFPSVVGWLGGDFTTFPPRFLLTSRNE